MMRDYYWLCLITIRINYPIIIIALRQNRKNLYLNHLWKLLKKAKEEKVLFHQLWILFLECKEISRISIKNLFKGFQRNQIVALF
jgi:hypothetical protein